MNVTVSRRAYLRQMVGIGAMAAMPMGSSLHAATPPSARRLDFHHHFASPRWIKRVVEAKRMGWQQIAAYKPANAIAAMDAAGVSTAFLSCTEPGVWVGDDFSKERTEAIALARDMNDYATQLRSEYKGRFGLFAVLPLPDVDASLREIEYAFDTLKADGVGLLTSYGTMWLGDRRLDPVFEELNRRKAVVYSHPTDATCCHTLLPNTNPGIVEWQTDTARAIWNVINDSTGTPSAATRFPDIRFIWSHGGGTMIGMANRFLGYTKLAPEDLAGEPPVNSKLYHLRRFYYDTAQVSNFVHLGALKQLVGAKQIVFGADYPYTPITDHVAQLRTVGFTPEELAGIDRGNGLRILPQYA